MKKIFLIILTVFMMCGCNNKYQNINLNEAKEKISKGAYLVDVRSKSEYKTEHILGAINIPLDNIEHPNKKIISKNDIIIVYCKSGGRSKIAAEKLINLGFKNVYDFGKMSNWY